MQADELLVQTREAAQAILAQNSDDERGAWFMGILNDLCSLGLDVLAYDNRESESLASEIKRKLAAYCVVHP